MDKLPDIVAAIVIFVLFLFFAVDSRAEDKFLSMQFNKNVVIRISNIDCPVKQLKSKFPFAAVATRKDGQHLFGCYTHDQDNIIIQWAGGDQSVLPANAFLQNIEPEL